MKIAISLSDKLYERADDLAKKRKISRSALYVAALQAYLDAEDDDAITAKLNDYYEAHPSSMDDGYQALQQRSLSRLDEWK